MTQTHQIDFYSTEDTCFGEHGWMASEFALRQVLAVSGSNLKEVFKKVPGSSRNSVRVVAAWWMVVSAGLPQFEVAKRLDMCSSSVGRAIRIVRTEHIRNPDSEIVEWARALEDSSSKNPIQLSNNLEIKRKIGLGSD